jgi:hypothetical protein
MTGKAVTRMRRLLADPAPVLALLLAGTAACRDSSGPGGGAGSSAPPGLTVSGPVHRTSAVEGHLARAGGGSHA